MFALSLIALLGTTSGENRTLHLLVLILVRRWYIPGGGVETAENCCDASLHTIEKSVHCSLENFEKWQDILADKPLDVWDFRI